MNIDDFVRAIAAKLPATAQLEVERTNAGFRVRLVLDERNCAACYVRSLADTVDGVAAFFADRINSHIAGSTAP